MIRLNNKFSDIVESGSNSSGEWIKFSSGDMIIRQTQYYSGSCYVSYGTLWRTGANSFPDFPVPFISPPNVQMYLSNAWKCFLMSGEVSPSKTNAMPGTYPQIISPIQNTEVANAKIDLLAIGKWK